MGFLATLRDRVVASDPGHARLFMAARATAAVATALGLLEILSLALHLPLSVPLLGAAIGMTWSITVNDTDPRDQRVTTLLLWLPSAAAVTLGTVTAPHRFLSDAIFVAILFVSFYIRRYGPRWISVGFMAVLGFFFTLFLRATFVQLPWLLAALAVTAVCTYFYRFVVFRDNPHYALDNGLAAFRARTRLITQTILEASNRGAWTPVTRRRLNHHVFRLNETALALDDILRAADAGDARAAVLETEIAVESLADAAARDPGAPDLHEQLRDVGKQLQRLAACAAHVRVSAGTWTPRGPFRAGTQVDTGAIAPTLRQAIQVTAASIAAIALGETFSTQRWYWAVLAAFVVFSGTASVGETLTKAWSRVVGTAAGILAGIAFVWLVRGNEPAETALMFVFLFFAVYTFRLSYAMMIFFITSVLSLMYALMGLFSDQLLVLRLVETLVGATMGGIAATLLLPIRTRKVMGNVMIEALTRLKDVIGTSVDRMTGDEAAEPLDAVRQFDEAMQSVRTQLLPLIAARRLSGSEVLRAQLNTLGGCGYYARNLAHAAESGAASGPAQTLKAEREAVTARIDDLVSAISANGVSTPAPALTRPPESDVASTYLYRIDRALRRLAQLLTSRNLRRTA